MVPSISIKPDPHEKAVYLTVKARGGRTSKHLTLYGVTVPQAIRLIRDAVKQEQENAYPRSDAA